MDFESIKKTIPTLSNKERLELFQLLKDERKYYQVEVVDNKGRTYFKSTLWAYGDEEDVIKNELREAIDKRNAYHGYKMIDHYSIKSIKQIGPKRGEYKRS